MMLAAAVYGCAYAAINAKYQRELKAKAKEAGLGEEPTNIEKEEDKELLEWPEDQHHMMHMKHK